MTYKYQYIRREMYEKNPAAKLNSNRSLKDMARLFKLPYWIMLASLLISVILLVIFLLSSCKGPIILVPMIVIILASVLIQIPREKYLYNNMSRNNEISERMMKYDQYISDVWHILHNHGIYTKEMVMILRSECEAALKIRENRFSTINNKIVDMLIGVPLGALIASIIYTDKAAIPAMIGALVIIGVAVLGVIKLIKIINFYSEGYFKDKYLLDAIDELIYDEIITDKKLQY